MVEKERICQICNEEVENEIYILLHWPYYADIQSILLDKMCDDNFIDYSEDEKIIRLMFYNWRITGFENMKKILFLWRLGDCKSQFKLSSGEHDEYLIRQNLSQPLGLTD